MAEKIPQRLSHTRFSRVLLQIFFFLGVASLLIFLGVWVWRGMQKSDAFSITHIQVHGQLQHETVADIQHIVKTNIRGDFFALNVSAVKQALLTQSWIADLAFRRVWPHTLIVSVTEQKPVARFNHTGVLSTTGSIFYPENHSIPASLPSFIGLNTQAPVLLNFYHVANTLLKPLGLTVIALQSDAEQSVRVTLNNQIQVVLGHQDVLSRFQRFVLLYPKILKTAHQSILLVDLRYPNGLAVQFKPPKNTA